MNVGHAFAGLGGWSTALDSITPTTGWAANHNALAIEYHERNHPTLTHYCQDLMEADWQALGSVDLLLASPACQGFSQAGKPAERRYGNHIDTKRRRDRNTTYAVLAAADVLRPPTIIVENVIEMQRDWQAFPAWVAMLEAFGYHVRAHRLWAHHWGAPTERERLVVTAALAGPIDLPARYQAPQATIGDCLDLDPSVHRWADIESKTARMVPRMRKAQAEAGSTCFWANVSESVGRPLDGLFPTATTQSVGGSQWYLLDGDRCRTITARELARAMTFPEQTQLPAKKQDAGRLLGNAVPPAMARGILEHVR